MQELPELPDPGGLQQLAPSSHPHGPRGAPGCWGQSARRLLLKITFPLRPLCSQFLVCAQFPGWEVEGLGGGEGVALMKEKKKQSLRPRHIEA